METLITAKDTWMLWAVILAGTALAIWLEQTYRWAARVSGPVIALVLAMLLSNVPITTHGLRIMPVKAAVYEVIGDYLVPLAVPLLLFRANVVAIVRTAGSMFVAFHVAALGTVLGAFLAVALMGDRVDHVAHVAGIMTGSYIGGGINFIAAKESFQLSENTTNPLMVADNFIMAAMFIVLLYLVSNPWLRRHYRLREPEPGDVDKARNLAAEHWKRKEIGLLDLAKCLAVAVAIVAVAFAGKAGIDASLPEGFARSVLGNPFVLITVLSVAAATLLERPMRQIHGPEELGAYLLYVFLFTIGLPADLETVVYRVPFLFLFCLIMAVTNLAVTLVLGKLLRLRLEDLLVCVNATLGGAPSAVAMVISKGWSRMVLPALLVGIWGYVIGTMIGVAVGQWLGQYSW